jgi:hypothetical protein
MPTKVKGTTGVDKIEAGAVITNPEFSGNATVTGTLTVNSTASINGSNLPQQFGFRNLLINGDMRIAQRGTSVASHSADSYTTVDRWKTRVGGLGVWTVSQDTDVPTGQGFANSIKWNCTTADASPASTDYLILQQIIEGQNIQHLKKGTANPESVTLSFWVKSNKTGTYIIELYDNDNIRQVSKSYTIDTADTWEKKTLTFAGDTTGAFGNDNGPSLYVVHWLAAGSSYQTGTLNTSWANSVQANRVVGQVNLADSTSNYINFTGVQLEVGSGASDFEFLPYDVQLQRCQRYFRTVGDGMIGRASSASVVYYSYHFENPMRSTPTMSIAPGATIRFGNFYSADYVGSSHSIVLARANTISVAGQINGFSGMTTADMLQSWQTNIPGWLHCNADL